VTTRWEGEVHEIYVAPEATGPMRSLRETRAVEGRGLEGDRYFDGVGTFSNKPGTLVTHSSEVPVENAIISGVAHDRDGGHRDTEGSKDRQSSVTGQKVHHAE